MTFDLPHLKLSEMTQLGSALRGVGAGARSMEEVARRVVGLLCDSFREPGTQTRQCVLARLYLTTPFASLDPDLRAFASRLMPDAPLLPGTRCLTLLATAGEQPDWNSRLTSRGHRTIPLPSAEVVRAIPMVSQLITQLGIDLGRVVGGDRSLVLEQEQRSYNVFHVERAEGSPYIPAQKEFVIPHRVQSVLGFGGVLPSSEIYAVLLFTRVAIARDVADIFRNAAMNLKVALLPFLQEAVFDGA